MNRSRVWAPPKVALYEFIAIGKCDACGATSVAIERRGKKSATCSQCNGKHKIKAGERHETLIAANRSIRETELKGQGSKP